MVRFQGDLLLGGAALRNLDGMIFTQSDTGRSRWSGRFVIDAQDQPAIELGRPYLLLLDDGRCGRVVVTSYKTAAGQSEIEVEFATLE